MFQSSEGVSNQEPADLVMNSAIGIDKNKLALLKDPKDRKPFDQESIERTQQEIAQLDPDQTQKLIFLNLNILNKEDEDGVDVDTRDAALGLIDLIDLGKIDKQFLFKVYCKAVLDLPKNADVYGSIDSTLSIGRKLAQYLPPGNGTEYQVRNAWNTVNDRYPESEGLKWWPEVSKVTQLIPRQEQQEDRELGWRDEPILEKINRLFWMST